MNRQHRRRGAHAARSAAAGLIAVGTLVGFGASAAFGQTSTGLLDNDPTGVVDGLTETVTDVVDEVTTALGGGGSEAPTDAITGVVDQVVATVEEVTGTVSGGGGGASNEAAPEPTIPLAPVAEVYLGTPGGCEAKTALIEVALPSTTDDQVCALVLLEDLNPTGETIIGLPPADDSGSGGGGGTGGGGDDPTAAITDGLTQLVTLIWDLEDAICASPLGDVLRELDVAVVEPNLRDVKDQVYAGLTDLFGQLGDALDNDQLTLLPLAVEITVEKLRCLEADDGGPGPGGNPKPSDPPDVNKPKPYAGGDYGGGDVGPTGDTDNGGDGGDGGGGTLPFTGAGALALASIGAGLVGGGQAIRRFSSRKSS